MIADHHPDAASPEAIVNAMTIDVEDYFHVSAFDGLVPRAEWDGFESRVCGNTDRLLALFADYEVRCTFFVLGWVAERFPDLVRRIAGQGHEIASHGYAHRLVYDQTPAAFRDDVKRAKNLLEDASGVRVRGYRAPSYSVTSRSLWALDILVDEGYEDHASIFPIHHDRYGIPVSARHPYVLHRHGRALVEMPASTVRVALGNLPIAGGGYFRLLPYAWTKWGISRLNRVDRQPAIFYLHPWEIDPGQPRLKAGLLSRLRHYRNLGKTEGRLRALLTDFRFGPLGTLVNGVGQEVSSDSVAVALPYVW